MARRSTSGWLGRSKQDLLLLGDQRADLLDESRNRTVKAQRRSGCKLNLAERCVFIEYVDRTELIEIKPRMRVGAFPQGFRAGDKCLPA